MPDQPGIPWPAVDRRSLVESLSAAVLNMELRLGWLYRLSRGVSVGVSAFASTWEAVPQAPVLQVFEVGLTDRREDTVVLSVLLLSVGWGG